MALRSRLLLAMALALLGALCVSESPSPIAAVAQVPLAPVTGLEIIGEVRPGTPNLPLLLVVQWDPVDGADGYELERADTPAPGADRVYQPVATLTGADRRPKGKIGYVDESGFAFAGGDCFRVRALRGSEAGEWAERCLPVPPSDGPRQPSPEDVDFRVEVTPDYELTLISWNLLPGFLGPSEIWNGDEGSPLVVVPAAAQPGRFQLVLPRFGGCLRLVVAGVPPIDSPCTGPPTDLPPPQLLQSLRDVTRVRVAGTGRPEAPIAVAWPRAGGPETVFKVDRVGGPRGGEIATLAARAVSIQGFETEVMLFLDPDPDAGGHFCYRVTETGYLGERLVGGSCGSDPIAPETGTGLLPAARDERAESAPDVLCAVVATVAIALFRRARA